jgi:hypothetical protein
MINIIKIHKPIDSFLRINCIKKVTAYLSSDQNLKKLNANLAAGIQSNFRDNTKFSD